jgi:hypothetical protein
MAQYLSVWTTLPFTKATRRKISYCSDDDDDDDDDRDFDGIANFNIYCKFPFSREKCKVK